MIITLEVAAACTVAAWVAAKVLTVLAEPMPPARQYLVGRRDNLQVADLAVYGDELLAIFAASPTIELTARTWWTANDPTARHRLERWRHEATQLQAYLRADGALTLADRHWGGNVACEPAMAVT